MNYQKLVNYTLLCGFLFTLLLSTSAGATPRYLSVHDSNRLWLKENSRTSPWIQLLNYNGGVYSVASSESSDRIAFIDDSLRLWIKQGGYTTPWVLVARNVYDVELVGNRIYVITSNYKLLVKEGSLYSGWLKLADDVYDVEASRNRIAVIGWYDGYTTELRVKEGGLYSSWVWLDYPDSNYDGSYSAPMFDVADNRVAMFDGEYDNFKVKTGDLYRNWSTYLYDGLGIGVKVYNNRVCINAFNGVNPYVACKDSEWLFESWTIVHRNSWLIDSTDTKISILNRGDPPYPTNAMLLLEGSLSNNSGLLHMDTGRGLVLSKF